MTFNPNADVSKNSARRPGRSTAIATGGVGGLALIIVLVISMLTGTDLTGLLNGSTSTQPDSSQQSALTKCETGQDANSDDSCRLAASTLAINQFWEGKVQGYRPPKMVLVDGSTPTPCGTASNATGPFYCPADESVYIDPSFFVIMRQQFGASAQQLAQLYVVAHEYGHHVQNITGIMNKNPSNGSGPGSNGVRLELQADCFAGAWVGEMTQQKDSHGVPYLQAPTKAELADALNAAAAVGDDHIQEQSGRVNPETWTHGSSDQRQRWFATGYQHGVGQCDTFAVSSQSL